MSATYRLREQVPAVLRLEPSASEPQLIVTIKKIVWTLEIAEMAVARFNALNGDKGVRYLWQTTRLCPCSTAAGLALVDADA